MYQCRITHPNKMPTTSEDFISSIIQAWGFVCNRIEEASDKRADFLVSDSTQLYFIELKTKFESPEGQLFARPISNQRKSLQTL
jgi:hypothetical protein